MTAQWTRTVDGDGRSAPPVRWTRAAAGRAEARRLDRWAAAVGPCRRASAARAAPRDGPVAIAAWNVGVGVGSLARFWRRVAGADGAARPRPAAALLQEVHSAGEALPGRDERALWAPRIGGKTDRVDVVSFARRFGLSLLYVPSMRNGRPGEGAPEDRGSAIVANVPLAEPRAVELPLERQRRVAVVASLALGPWTLSVCSLHLENRAPWRRVWRTLGPARRRQMERLLAAFPGSTEADAFVLGGDFNTWVRGRREGAYRLARARFPGPEAPDPRPTHRFEVGGALRPSDHLLFRLPAGWRGRCRRLDDAFGSDHYPLLGTISPPA